jgi:hypothetical protein
MPTTPHVEQHFFGSESVRDAVIGVADDLTGSRRQISKVLANSRRSATEA